MTVEAFAPTAPYTVSGTGPYAIQHAYKEDAIIAFVEETGGVLVPLVASTDFTVSPASGDAGTLTLTATAAATHDGKPLYIDRETPIEQGFSGQTSREVGLEANVDRIAMGVQEAKDAGANALRVVRGPVNAYAPEDMKAPIWSDEAGGFVNGPSVSEIENAEGWANLAAQYAGLIGSFVVDTFDTLQNLLDDTKNYANGALIRVRDANRVYTCVGTSGGQITNSATTPSHFDPVCGPGNPVTPEHFAVNVNPGTTDMIVAINKAKAWAADNDVPGECYGDYGVSDTVNLKSCDWNWGQTRLHWIGSDITTLTEMLHNPQGSTSPQPSGKYLLVDAKDARDASYGGWLTIIGKSIANMTLAEKAKIEPNLVGISASQGTSERITWNKLHVIGCGHGPYQGDQRGSAKNILPMTRWSGKELRIQFCLVGIEDGNQGNGFDELDFQNIEIARTKVLYRVKSNGNWNKLFLKGYRFATDAEAITGTATAGNTTVLLSGDILDEEDVSRIKVGMTVAIENAADNLNGSNALPHVTRIVSWDGANLVVETAPERNVVNAKLMFDLPFGRFAVADGSILHIYTEGVFDVPVLCYDGARIWCPSIKPSDGEFGCRYKAPIVIVGSSNVSVRGELNTRGGANNDEVCFIVGVPTLIAEDLLSGNNCIVDIKTRHSIADFTSSAVIGGIKLESDHKPSGFNTTAGAPHTNNQLLSVTYDDGEQYYQVLRHGPATPLQLVDGRSYLSLGPNLRGATDMTGMTHTGGCSVVAGGIADKAELSAAGTWYEDVAIVPGDDLVIDFTIDDYKQFGTSIMLWDSSGGGGAGSQELGASQLVNVRGKGSDRVRIKVPEGSTADRIGFNCAANAALTISKFVVRKEIRE